MINRKNKVSHLSTKSKETTVHPVLLLGTTQEPKNKVFLYTPRVEGQSIVLS